MRSSVLYSLIEKTKLLFPSLIKRIKDLRNVINAFPPLHKKLLPLLCLSVFILLLLPISPNEINSDTNNSRHSITLKPIKNVTHGGMATQTADGLAPVIIKVLDPKNITGEWRAHVIRKGDSVYRIFRQYNIPATVLHDLIALQIPARYITNVKPGQIMSFYIATKGELIQLRISDDEDDTIVFSRREDGSYIYQQE